MTRTKTLALVLLTMFSAHGWAAIITVSQDLNLTTSARSVTNCLLPCKPSTTASDERGFSRFLQGFDALLGTLLNVEVSILNGGAPSVSTRLGAGAVDEEVADFTDCGFLENCVTDVFATFDTQSSITLNLPGIGRVDGAAAGLQSAIGCADDPDVSFNGLDPNLLPDIEVTFGEGLCTAGGSKNSNGLLGDLDVTSAALADWIGGAGWVEFAVRLKSTSNVLQCGNGDDQCFASQTAILAASARVTYTYDDLAGTTPDGNPPTALPTPETTLLLALGALALGLCRRRRAAAVAYRR